MTGLSYDVRCSLLPLASLLSTHMCEVNIKKCHPDKKKGNLSSSSCSRIQRPIKMNVSEPILNKNKPHALIRESKGNERLDKVFKQSK